MTLDRFIISSARLRLEPMTDADVATLVRHWGDAPVRRYLWADAPVTYDMVSSLVTTSNRDFARRGYGMWAVRLPASEALLGACGLRLVRDSDCVELLFSLKPRHWGHGYATEAVAAVLDYAFCELGMRRLVAFLHGLHPAARSVLGRVGMAFDEPCSHDAETPTRLRLGPVQYGILTKDAFLLARPSGLDTAADSQLAASVLQGRGSDREPTTGA